MLVRLATYLAELGFQHFRALLAVASSVSLWICAVWAGWVVRGDYPPASALLALPILYAITVATFRSDRHPKAALSPRAQGAVQTAARVWLSCSFAALFSAATLTVVAVLWTLGEASLATLVVQAGTITSAAAADTATIDPLFRWIASGGMISAALAIGYGYTAGQRRVSVTRLQLPVHGLPAELSGLRIVQLSDIHIGSYLDDDRLTGFINRVNALEPDLIVITGDIVDHRLADLPPALPFLSKLRARHGVIAILGNHDHHVGSDAVAAHLEAGTHFTVLRDGRTTIGSGTDGRLHIIGIEDRGGAIVRGAHEEQHLQMLLADVPAGEAVILLAHRPELFDSAAAAGVALTLSGHTHGGQVALRLGGERVLGPGNLMSRFTRGLFEQKGSYLYVNRGLGVVGQPVRVGALREIAVFELACATAPDTRAAA